jgi:glycine cleavage system H protein
VSEIYAPLAGTVVEVNPDLEANPELVNSDPYGAGWIAVVELADPSSLDSLMDATAYRELTEG